MIGFLLVVLIATLNYSAIQLFIKDKKAYVYDYQANSAALAGREFASQLQNAIDDLKLQLGTFNFEKPNDENIKTSMQFLLDNQKGLSGVRIGYYDSNLKKISNVYQYFIPNFLQSAAIKAEDIEVSEQQFDTVKTELFKDGYSFLNISKTGQSPMLAVFFSSLTNIKGTTNTAYAVGFVSLKSLYVGAKNTQGSQVILDKKGNLILHSDSKEMFSAKSYASDLFFIEARGSSINSGAKEWTTPAGKKLLSSYYKPGLELTVIAEMPYETAMKSTYKLSEQFVVLSMFMLGLAIIVGVIFAKRITAPLLRLFQATEVVSAGNFEISLPVTSRDEIGVLTSSFITMSRKISELIKQMLDKMRVDQELQIAKTVQQSLFPQILIENDKILIASHYESASECGGDWWGTFNHEGKQIIAISDATGHGLPSALITAAARSCFSVIEKLVTTSKIAVNPSEILSIANRVVYDSSQGQIMMTYFVGIIDFEHKVIRYSSAAHNPPWLFSKNAEMIIKMSSLTAKGIRLGESRDSAEFEVKEQPFHVDDVLFMYTDGIIEGKNLDGVQYGKKRLRKLLEENISKTPTQVLERVVEDFHQYNTGKTFDDDITLAIMRINH